MGMDFRNQMGNTTRFSLFNTLSGVRFINTTALPNKSLVNSSSVLYR